VFQLFALVLRNADKSPVRPFIPCSARHFCKGAKFPGSVGHPMTKMLSASRGLRPPDPLTRGSAPGPRWGLCPQTPVIRLCSALAMVPAQPLTPSNASDPHKFTPMHTTLKIYKNLHRPTAYFYHRVYTARLYSATHGIANCIFVFSTFLPGCV